MSNFYHAGLDLPTPLSLLVKINNDFGRRGLQSKINNYTYTDLKILYSDIVGIYKYLIKQHRKIEERLLQRFGAPININVVKKMRQNETTMRYIEIVEIGRDIQKIGSALEHYIKTIEVFGVNNISTITVRNNFINILSTKLGIISDILPTM